MTAPGVTLPHLLKHGISGTRLERYKFYETVAVTGAKAAYTGAITLHLAKIKTNALHRAGQQHTGLGKAVGLGARALP